MHFIILICEFAAEIGVCCLNTKQIDQFTPLTKIIPDPLPTLLEIFM